MRDDDLRAMREEYEKVGLSESTLATDWVSQFRSWLDDAVRASLVEPNWVVLATADARGRPSARCVLLKGCDARGLVVYTNYESRKGRDLAENPYASIVVPWVPLQRQVVVCGPVERTSAAESDAYFAARPWGARLGAAASPQSVVVASRAELDAAWDALAARHPEGAAVPRPDHWGGFRLVPETVEFWQGRRNRLHDRLRYRATDAGWVVERLAP